MAAYKSIMLLLLMITMYQVFGQKSCAPLLHTVDRLYNEKKFDSAILMARKARQTCLLESGISDSNYVSSLIYLAGLEFLKQKYIEAAPILVEGISAVEQNPKFNLKYYNYFLTKLLACYYYTSNYDSAEFRLKRAVSTMRGLYGENDPNYGDWINNLAVLYMRQSRYKEAEPLEIKSLQISENSNRIASDDYATTLSNLGIIYKETGNYEKSELFLKKALSIHEKVFGTNSIQYGTDLNNLGLLYTKKNDFSAAEPLFFQSVKIRKEASGDRSYNYAISVINLALFYQNFGRYKIADSLYKEAFLLFGFPPMNTDSVAFSSILNGIGGLYISMGKYNQAEQFLTQALQIRGKYLGVNNPQYATTQNNLAELYKAEGNNEAEEGLLKAALITIEKSYGKEHIDYATCLNNLGDFYKEIGSYTLADSLFFRSLQIRRKILGDSNSGYASSLINLASVKINEGKYDSVENLYKKAIFIFKNSFGIGSPQYATVEEDLGQFYNGIGAYSKARHLLEESFHVREEVFGKSSSEYARSLNNLAMLYFNLKYYDSAYILFRKALGIYKSTMGNESAEYSTILTNLALVHYLKHDLDTAINLFSEVNKNLLNYMTKRLSFLSEKELTLFIKTEKNNLDVFHSITLNTHSDSLTRSSLDLTLLLKGIGLQNITQLQRSLAMSKDSLVQSKYEDYLGLRKQITKLAEKSINQSDSSIGDMETRANDLEKDLMRLSPEFQKQVSSNSMTWRDLQRSLKPGEAAIEFTDFDFWDRRWTDSSYYAAYIIRKTGDPVMVKLCELRQLRAQFKSFDSLEDVDMDNRGEGYEGKYQGYINRLYRYGGADSLSLYGLLWQPLDSLLKGVGVVYYSPSGLMNRLNLGAVECPDKKLLSKKYQLHLLPNTRDKVGYRPTDIGSGDMLAYGGVQYEMDDDQLKDAIRPYPSDGGLSYPSGATRSGGALKPLEILEGSVLEEDSITAMARANGISCTALSGFGANEESFKYFTSLEKGASPSIVHISTHGFFFPDPPPQKPTGVTISPRFFVNSLDPLLRCGLFLAGANNAIEGSPIPEGIREDGILTGSEISNLNLRQTKLVVLSACETGLGKIDDNEGVYGLQRAFKMAGARNLVMSLWRVNDNATQVFMTMFYLNALKGRMSVYDAFTKAQADMSSDPRFKAPYYWAAFVLME